MAYRQREREKETGRERERERERERGGRKRLPLKCIVCLFEQLEKCLSYSSEGTNCEQTGHFLTTITKT